MPVPLKNTNAAKPARERRTQFLGLRVKASDKARWKTAATGNGMTLAAWAEQLLNRAADRYFIKARHDVHRKQVDPEMA